MEAEEEKFKTKAVKEDRGYQLQEISNGSSSAATCWAALISQFLWTSLWSLLSSQRSSDYCSTCHCPKFTLLSF